MIHPRIPSDGELMQMPPGDRGPRLRSLLQYHRDQLDALDLAHPDALTRKRLRRHTRTIAGIEHIAARLTGTATP